MEFLHARKQEKRNRTDFLLSNAFNIYNLKILGYFDTSSLDIVFLIWFLRHFVPKHMLKRYLKQFSRQRLDIVQNVLIPSNPKISQGANCANTFKLKNIPRGQNVLIPSFCVRLCFQNLLYKKEFFVPHSD